MHERLPIHRWCDVAIATSLSTSEQVANFTAWKESSDKRKRNEMRHPNSWPTLNRGKLSVLFLLSLLSFQAMKLATCTSYSTRQLANTHWHHFCSSCGPVGMTLCWSQLLSHQRGTGSGRLVQSMSTQTRMYVTFGPSVCAPCAIVDYGTCIESVDYCCFPVLGGPEY